MKSSLRLWVLIALSAVACGRASEGERDPPGSAASSPSAASGASAAEGGENNSLTGGAESSANGSGSEPSEAQSGGSTSDEGSASTGSGSSGGTSGNLDWDPCEEFSCPELGDCSIEMDGDECIRVCNFTEEPVIETQADVDRLSALHCVDVRDSLKVTGPEVQTLEGLESIREFLGLSSAHNISMPALVSISNSFFIALNEGVMTLDFASLEEAQEFRLFGNPELLSLAGLAKLQGDFELQISGNSRLKQCEVDAFAERFRSCSICENNEGEGTCD